MLFSKGDPRMDYNTVGHLHTIQENLIYERALMFENCAYPKYFIAVFIIGMWIFSLAHLLAILLIPLQTSATLDIASNKFLLYTLAYNNKGTSAASPRICDFLPQFLIVPISMLLF